MPTQVLTDTAASISELKANPMKVASSGNGSPVAVLNRNETAFYCVPAAAYEALMEQLEDAELLALANARADETPIPVSFDEL